MFFTRERASSHGLVVSILLLGNKICINCVLPTLQKGPGSRPRASQGRRVYGVGKTENDKLFIYFQFIKNLLKINYFHGRQ